MQIKNKKQPPQLPMQIKMPQVPRAFINNDKIKLVLCHIANDFEFEERQALYFYCFLGAPINEIAEKVGLSQKHVVNVLGLYAERLTNKLDLFQKSLPYDANDSLPVSEIL